MITLLICPNDAADMRTVRRAGVDLDVCPTCRSVWLDRGELEKLLGAGPRDAGEPALSDAFGDEPRSPARPPSAGPFEFDHSWNNDGRSRERRAFDIFDFSD